MGVEEEYFLVDSNSFALRPRGQSIVLAAKEVLGENVKFEMSTAQAEIATDICEDISTLSNELRSLRSRLDGVAQQLGTRIAAVGTHPFSDWVGQGITQESRYLDIEEQYQQLAWEQLVSGCHVHVGISDRQLAIDIMLRARPWLPAMLALFANSPYWQGVDTRYASYRCEVFGRWPTAGMPPPLRTVEEYEAMVNDLLTAGMGDASFLYWDLRPSSRYPTLEFRVADVCASVDETVALAALVRALVETCANDVENDAPLVIPRDQLLRVARWRAARYGLRGQLVDVETPNLVAAGHVVRKLLELVRPILERRGEWNFVELTVRGLLGQGNGAERQRTCFNRTGDLHAVMQEIVDTTVEAHPSGLLSPQRDLMDATRWNAWRPPATGS